MSEAKKKKSVIKNKHEIQKENSGGKYKSKGKKQAGKNCG